MPEPRPAATPEALHAEVIALAQELIRLDTSNATGHSPGNETLVAEHLQAYLAAHGVRADLIAREPHRAHLVARLPGRVPGARSMALVGHTDVVPVDRRDWTHDPFGAVIDDQGFLHGRGAVDMKDQVAARTVAFVELARTGFQPEGDLWLLMTADEEDGLNDLGMEWLLATHPEIRMDIAINEGGGEILPLSDGRRVGALSVGEKGTQPIRVVAHGEAGHASTPTVGNNAVPLLAQLIARLGPGLPDPRFSPQVAQTLRILNGGVDLPLEEAVHRAAALHPTLRHLLPAFMGTTMAPTMVEGSFKRNVMPARAWVELDCRVLPGTTPEEVADSVRKRLGDDISYELEFTERMVEGSASPATGDVVDAIAAFHHARGDGVEVLPVLCAGFTDSVYLRAAGVPEAYGYTPYLHTPAEVLAAGYHNANERVHVDDLLVGVEFHLDLVRRLLGP